MSQRDRTSTTTVPGGSTAPRPGGLAAHDTDVVGLLFGLTFLVCAALAVAVRTGSLGFGSEQPTGGWIAGAMLAVVGLVGVVGTLATLRRRAGAASAEPTSTPLAPPISSPSWSDPVEDQPVEDLPVDDPAVEDLPGGSGGRDVEADETEVLDPPPVVEE